MDDEDNIYRDITMDKFTTMSKQEQLDYVEKALIELWDNDIVDLIGFDENKQPLFVRKTNKHG